MTSSRTVFGIVAFAAAFIVSVSIVRIILPAPVPGFVNDGISVQHRTHKDCKVSKLEEFIERDKMNGSLRNDRPVVGERISANYALSVREYWESSSSMDASDFPRDFREAWNDHMKAWRDYSRYLESVRGQQVTKSDFRSGSERYDAEISRTWEIVLSTAREYGADVW